MASSSTYRKNPKILLGQDNNALVLLFAANMIMFAALHILSMIYQLSDIPMEFFQKQILNWLVLPASADTLAGRPWTMVMYMFTHYSFWHLVSSMLWLWGFGFILQDLAGNNKMIPIYLYGGFTGALCFLLAANLLPNGTAIGSMLGASAAVMAIAIATTTLAPDYRIFPLIGGGIPLWVLTLVYVAIDFGTVGKGNAPVAIAHLGAGLIGFLFIHQMKRGRDWAAWMNNLVDWLNDLFHPDKKKRGSAERLHYLSDRKPFEKKANITQQKLDAILDKINQKGYDGLSEEEKDFLKRASKEQL
ncbi:MAG: rhomboid family intramembrane serine protease [Chitinophagaceae bacterium]|nr:rhomboid family intramembrane serine protease [Chitinophagaceae bacterium]